MSIFTFYKPSRTAGMSLIEILIGAAIISVGILAVINAYSLYVKYALNHDRGVQSTYLLEEGLEAMTLMRDDSWTTHIAPLTASTSYPLYFSGTAWSIGTTTEYIDGVFFRTVAVYNVVRESGTDKIGATGTADVNTKKVTVTVAYRESEGTTTESLSKYLLNIYSN